MNCGGLYLYRLYFQEIQQPTVNSKYQIIAMLSQIFFGSRVPTENQICQITSGFVENWNWKIGNTKFHLFILNIVISIKMTDLNKL